MQAYFSELRRERAPSWIQTRKRFGERQKCVPGVGVRLKGGVTREGEGKEKEG